jgi:hypothetical protein
MPENFSLGGLDLVMVEKSEKLVDSHFVLPLHACFLKHIIIQGRVGPRSVYT